MNSLSMSSTRYRRRKFVNQVMTILAYVCTAAVIIPLVWIIVYVIIKGLGTWDVEFFTGLPKLFGTGGGVRNGIVGTFLITGLATLMGVPVGVMAGLLFGVLGEKWPPS